MHAFWDHSSVPAWIQLPGNTSRPPERCETDGPPSVASWQVKPGNFQGSCPDSNQPFCCCVRFKWMLSPICNDRMACCQGGSEEDACREQSKLWERASCGRPGCRTKTSFRTIPTSSCWPRSSRSCHSPWQLQGKDFQQWSVSRMIRVLSQRKHSPNISVQDCWCQGTQKVVGWRQFEFRRWHGRFNKINHFLFSLFYTVVGNKTFILKSLCYKKKNILIWHFKNWCRESWFFC